MNPILHPIFALLASVTRQELARQVTYRRKENKILRARLPERLVATPQEKRRLLKFGRKLGVQLRDLISIVSDQSFVRWIRKKDAAHSAKQTSRKSGRPQTPDEIGELVLKLARKTELGLHKDSWRTQKAADHGMSFYRFKLTRSGNAIFYPRQFGQQKTWLTCICSYFCTSIHTKSGFHRAPINWIPHG